MTFGSLAERQVRSPEHLRLDTVLLNTEVMQLLYTVYRKGKTTLSVRGLVELKKNLD